MKAEKKQIVFGWTKESLSNKIFRKIISSKIGDKKQPKRRMLKKEVRESKGKEEVNV